MRIGIDLGGTKTEAIALALTGEVLDRRRVATPPHLDGTIDAIVGLIDGIERVTGQTGTIGVGIPGTVIPNTGRVAHASARWIDEQPLGTLLEARLDRPVRVMNDANCFAISEAPDGAAAGARVVFGVILGTGVGGGVVIDGRCHVGPNQIAGEWGHMGLPRQTPHEHPGPACWCGRRGCVETFLSGPSLVRDHEHATGRRIGTREIVQAAAAGDAEATATMARYHDRLGRALATVVDVLDPDVIVLGGGMSNVDGIAESARTALARHAFSRTLATRVVRNTHGDASGVRGAAWLWPASP